MRDGAGSDRFAYQSLDDAGDTILDFDTGPGGDRLLLTDLFDLGGGTPDVMVDLVDQGDGTEVRVDPDGQGNVGLVTLAGVPATSLDVLVTDTSVEVAGAAIASNFHRN